MSGLSTLIGGLFKSNVDLGPDFPALKRHVIDRLNATDVGKAPFYHAWVEDVFPRDFYDALFGHMKSLKNTNKMQPRMQDNPEFANRRFNLVGSKEPVVQQFHAIWSDPEVKQAVFSKFYEGPNLPKLVDKAHIHEEFEYVFCEPERFQNIHVDIPPKVLSFVFYLPDGDVDEDQEKKNATILYGKDLEPQYAARFRANSVCIFAQHFYSYHGFSSTIERDALVMFMVEPGEFDRWKVLRKNEDEPYEGFLKAVDEKLQKFTLKEYGTDPEKRARERAECEVNAPKGRVLMD